MLSSIALSHIHKPKTQVSEAETKLDPIKLSTPDEAEVYSMLKNDVAKQSFDATQTMCWLELQLNQDPEDPIQQALAKKFYLLKTASAHLNIPLIKPATLPSITLLYGYSIDETEKLIRVLKQKMKTPLYFRGESIWHGDTSPVIILRLTESKELQTLFDELRSRTRKKGELHYLHDGKYHGCIPIAELDKNAFAERYNKATNKNFTDLTAKKQLDLMQECIRKLNLDSIFSKESKQSPSSTITNLCERQVKFTTARSFVEENGECLEIDSYTARIHVLKRSFIPGSLHKQFKNIYNLSPETYIFGGLSRNALYRTFLKEKLDEIAVVATQFTDLDILTSAKKAQLKRLYGKSLEESTSVPGLYWVTDKKIDIRLITDHDELILGKNMGYYADCTMNSILVTESKKPDELDYLDPTGKGVADLYDGIITDLDPQDSVQLNFLKLQLKFGFKLSQITQKNMVDRMFELINSGKFTDSVNDKMLKILLSNRADKVLERLISPLSDKYNIPVINLIFTADICEALQAAYQSPKHRAMLIQVIESLQSAYFESKAISPTPFYALIIKLVIRYERIQATSEKRMRWNELVYKSPLMSAVVPKEPVQNLLLEHSLFRTLTIPSITGSLKEFPKLARL